MKGEKLVLIETCSTFIKDSGLRAWETQRSWGFSIACVIAAATKQRPL